jgi:cellulose synthase/poly-beta-1,6-N-acetylglucosamine synthase-like glycosyltransferase
MKLWSIVCRARQVANAHAGALLLVGSLAVALVNVSKWRHDRALALHLQALRSAPPRAVPVTPRVSILVAAWNEADMIEQHLGSVAALRYPDVEHVVGAGGPDGTYDLARRYASPRAVILEQHPGEGKQAALRRCLEHASGEVVFLTDADCVLDDRSFERTIGPILRGEAEATTGGWRPLPECLSRSAVAAFRWSADAYAAAHAAPETTGLHGRNAAVTRHALDRAGKFSADVPSGTDYHLAKSLIAAGVRIRRVAESEVSTRDRPGIAAYARQQRRWLRNVVLLGLRFRARREVLAALQTSLLGLVMMIMPAVALLLGPSVLICWLLAVGHGALSKVRYLAFARLSHDDLGRVVPARIFVQAVPVTLAELAVAVGPLVDYLNPKRRPSW